VDRGRYRQCMANRVQLLFENTVVKIERRTVMKKMPGFILAVALAGLILPPTVWGADQCPPELTQAKAALSSAQAAQKSASKTAKSQEVQAPRTLAGAKTQELQAPRAQELQAPRAQELQAPRAQELQAPRAQELQAPRAQELQAPRAQELQAPRAQELQAPRAQELQAPRTRAGARSPDVQTERINKASALIREGDAACKKGDMALATQKAKEALAVLK
jgi:hypothetical protein